MVLLAASAISIASTIPSWAVLHLSFLTNVSFGHSLLAQANDVFLVFTLLASITLSECVQTPASPELPDRPPVPHWWRR